MLPSSHRLPGHRLPAVFNSKHTFHSPFFTLKLLKRSTAQPTRISIIVSTKVSSRAVTRNRLKRLLHQAIYSQLTQLHPGYDLVFVTKPAMKNQSLSTITSTLVSILSQAQLI